MTTELTEKEPRTSEDVFIFLCSPNYTWFYRGMGEK